MRMNHSATRQRCRGFTIVELMVALIISLILLAGVMQIYLSGKQSFDIQDTLSRLQENGRFATEAIAVDLRRAGYWGGNAQVEAIAGSLGTADPDGTCLSANNTWGRMIERRIFGLNDTNGGYACIPGADYIRGDILTVRYASPQETAPADMDSNRPYLRSSLFSGRLFNGMDQASNLLNNPPAPSERTSELVAHAYYIGPSNQQCGGAAVPSLYRERLANNGRPVAEEVAYGVDNLQVQYGVDTNDDNSVDNYVDAGAVADWAQVMAARVWILVRAECPEGGYTNTNTYTMAGVNYVVNDGFRRQLYTTTVNLRNRI